MQKMLKRQMCGLQVYVMIVVIKILVMSFHHTLLLHLYLAFYD